VSIVKPFVCGGIVLFWEIAPGRGRKATYQPERIKAVIDATLQSKPKGMAQVPAHGGQSGYQQVHGQQRVAKSQHQTAPPRDPRLLEKLTDVVGLY
jgi:hypothetical protein